MNSKRLFTFALLSVAILLLPLIAAAEKTADSLTGSWVAEVSVETQTQACGTQTVTKTAQLDIFPTKEDTYGAFYFSMADVPVQCNDMPQPPVPPFPEETEKYKEYAARTLENTETDFPECCRCPEFINAEGEGVMKDGILELELKVPDRHNLCETIPETASDTQEKTLRLSLTPSEDGERLLLGTEDCFLEIEDRCVASITGFDRSGPGPWEEPELELRIPYLSAADSGYTDYLLADNLGAEYAEFSLILYDKDGARLGDAVDYEVPGHGSRQIDLDRLAPTAASGRITYSAVHLKLRMGYGSITDGDYTELSLDDLNTASAAPGLAFRFTEPPVSGASGTAGYLNLLNSGKESLNVLLTAYSNGEEAGETELTLKPGAVNTESLTSLFPSLSAPDRITAVTRGWGLMGTAVITALDGSNLLVSAPYPLFEIELPFDTHECPPCPCAQEGEIILDEEGFCPECDCMETPPAEPAQDTGEDSPELPGLNHDSMPAGAMMPAYNEHPYVGMVVEAMTPDPLQQAVIEQSKESRQRNVAEATLPDRSNYRK